ncbi:MAG: YhcH/YjgK/YiaL family protein [Kiritimatiellaceae bacterium]|nr:YhcH/YjgK/YiaL family protein [Kiritimatiellaceae bacterium]
MILDTLDHADQYVPLHPGFRAAFNFLRRTDLSELPDGKIEIDGDRVFAIINHVDGRCEKGAQLEGHRNHIDIQYLISGDESIGWRSADSLTVSVDYNTDKDLLFFSEPSDSMVRVPPGSFAVFFPEDAHLPLVGNGPIHKVIIKILI